MTTSALFAGPAQTLKSRATAASGRFRQRETREFLSSSTYPYRETCLGVAAYGIAVEFASLIDFSIRGPVGMKGRW